MNSNNIKIPVILYFQFYHVYIDVYTKLHNVSTLLPF